MRLADEERSRWTGELGGRRCEQQPSPSPVASSQLEVRVRLEDGAVMEKLAAGEPLGLQT